jgi:hypothetical protein
VPEQQAHCVGTKTRRVAGRACCTNVSLVNLQASFVEATLASHECSLSSGESFGEPMTDSLSQRELLRCLPVPECNTFST